MALTAGSAPCISLPGTVGSSENGFWPLITMTEIRKPEDLDASLLQMQIHNLHLRPPRSSGEAGPVRAECEGKLGGSAVKCPGSDPKGSQVT